jgi:hypothetical protein
MKIPLSISSPAASPRIILATYPYSFANQPVSCAKGVCWPSSTTSFHLALPEIMSTPSKNYATPATEEWTAAFQAAELSVKHQETLTKTMNFQFWAKRHDPTMQSYLRSLLTESSGPTAAFLNPQKTADGTTFQLLEAITIATKPEP